MNAGPPPGRHTFFAVALPGLEPLVAAELDALGFAAVRAEEGGVAFEGALLDGFRANLLSRLATRVLLRLGSFPAPAPAGLERGLATLPWGLVLHRGAAVKVRVASHGSRLRGPRLERSAQALVAAARDRLPPPRAAAQAPAEPQEILVRIVADRCVFSADLSGERLDRRGYRTLVSQAPLRETLAAAVLGLAGWTPAQPLVDPFCGAGTFVIEAAAAALGVAPGAGRGFAFEHWPSFDRTAWEAAQTTALAGRRERPPAPIVGRDADPAVVGAARSNAERAGVAHALDLAAGAVADLVPPVDETGPLGPGLVVANPPWGRRLGTRGGLRPLYRQLGGVLASRFRGWRAAILCPDRTLERELRLLVTARHPLPHGGQRVDLILAALC